MDTIGSIRTSRAEVCATAARKLYFVHVIVSGQASKLEQNWGWGRLRGDNMGARRSTAAVALETPEMRAIDDALKSAFAGKSSCENKSSSCPLASFRDYLESEDNWFFHIIWYLGTYYTY